MATLGTNIDFPDPVEGVIDVLTRNQIRTFAGLVALFPLYLVLQAFFESYWEVSGEEAMFLVSLVAGGFGFVANYLAPPMLESVGGQVFGPAVILANIAAVSIGMLVFVYLMPPSPFADGIERVLT